MDVITLIFILIGGVLVLGLGIYLLFLIFRDDEEKFEDNLIINFMSNYTIPIKGHAVGLEIETKRIGNRYLIEYLPRDINRKRLEINKNIDTVKVAVDKNKMLVLPEGTLSGYRNVKILLPPKPEDFTDNLKTTLFGQAMMKLTEEINGANVESIIIREGSNRKDKLLKELGDGEISEEYIQRQKEINKEIDKMKQDSRGSSSSSSPSPFRPPSFPPSSP